VLLPVCKVSVFFCKQFFFLLWKSFLHIPIHSNISCLLASCLFLVQCTQTLLCTATGVEEISASNQYLPGRGFEVNTSFNVRAISVSNQVLGIYQCCAWKWFGTWDLHSPCVSVNRIMKFIYDFV
jgi:hypothetical protein